MQSGSARTRAWRLEFEPESAKSIESLMGWTSSSDVKDQVRLDFESREAAEAFCQRHAIPYRVREPHERQPQLRSYADNFRRERPT